MSCEHEKICAECIKKEIAELEAKIRELQDKLPSDRVMFIERNTIPVPYYPSYPYNPFLNSPQVTWRINIQSLNQTDFNNDQLKQCLS